MPDAPTPRSSISGEAERWAALERRIARIEARLGLESESLPESEADAAIAEAPAVRAPTGEELEYEVGQNWFALAGVIALAVGAAFLLTLPFASLPRGSPSLAGYAVVAALLGLARFWRESFALIAGYLRGAAMGLLLLATLRLSLPAERALWSLGSVGSQALLLAVVAANFVLALRRRSPWLAGLALVTGCAAALAVDTPGFTVALLGALAAAAVGTSHRYNWPVLGLVAVPLVYATYLLWSLGDPLVSGRIHWVAAPYWVPVVLPAIATILAAGALYRPKDEAEGPVFAITAMLNCALGYGTLFVYSIAICPEAIGWLHAVAFAVFLGVAVLFWVRRQSRAATFFYAMTGYAALTVAILKVAPSPPVFVWLSLQSVVVVATAIWFRSRFIVVANFLIYVGIVLAYMMVTERETGISVGFGLVALVSARILNWQKNRLELKTELMRNAYLASAFVVFPYALYHFVPVRQVGFVWIGLALVYYALHFAMRNQKYRWMGHGTLLLTMCYLAVVGTRQFEPVFRVLSFLALGTVLLVVSLMFTRARRRGPAGDATQTSTKPPP